MNRKKLIERDNLKLDQFTNIVCKILLSKPTKKAIYENRKPTIKELKELYKIIPGK